MHQKIIFFFLFSFFCTTVWAQNKEEEAIKQTIDKLFMAMQKSDSVTLRSVFHPTARMLTVVFSSKENKHVIREESVNNFVAFVGQPRKELIEERLKTYQIQIDGNLATAWTPYEFYIDGVFSHCGVDAFQLFKTPENVWQIIQITDTRRKEGCQ